LGKDIKSKGADVAGWQQPQINDRHCCQLCYEGHFACIKSLANAETFFHLSSLANEHENNVVLSEVSGRYSIGA